LRSAQEVMSLVDGLESMRFSDAMEMA